MLDVRNPPQVMLCQSEMKKPIEFYAEWSIEEKSDGIRALIIKEGTEIRIYGRNPTKKGRANFTNSLPEIVEYFKKYPMDFSIDGELMSSDFLTLQTKVRTTKTVIHDPCLYFKVFDILYWNEKDFVKDETPHYIRFENLQNFLKDIWKACGESKLIRQIVHSPKPLTDRAYMSQCMQKVLDRNGEGLVIKNPQGIYKPGKRSADLIKVVSFFEMDVVFLEAIEGEGKYIKTLGALKTVSLEAYERGHLIEEEFNVGTGWDDMFRSKIWVATVCQDKFLPIPGKIKYKNLYPSKLPRMPVFHSFNVDKIGPGWND